jgi:hypothetical protein
MVKRIIFSLCVLLLGGILLLRVQPLTLAAPDLYKSTPTPVAEEEAAAQEEAPAQERTLQDLLARIEVLEAQVATLSAQTSPMAQINQVTTAVYLLDDAGLHELDVRLNQEGMRIVKGKEN